MGAEVVGNKRQVGGNHYTNLAITPREFAVHHSLGIDEFSILKYMSRHRAKNGKEDLEKVLHHIELLCADQYDNWRGISSRCDVLAPFVVCAYCEANGMTEAELAILTRILCTRSRSVIQAAHAAVRELIQDQYPE